MRFLIMTDIEGVTGVTTYQQAESGQLGKDMLMHDLLAVIEGIRAEEHHEIVIYDMHTDGRNVDITKLPEDISVIVGKPVNGKLYKSIGGEYDGLFMVGLHAMAGKSGALLDHSYLRAYESISLDGVPIGEIGMERALATEQGFPLVFVSGDDKGCEEARELDPDIVTAVVKKSLGEDQAICYPPAKTAHILRAAAKAAVLKAGAILPERMNLPVKIQVKFSDCTYLHVMKKLYPDVFTDDQTIEMEGDNLLECWSCYLAMERAMMAEGNI